MEWITIIGTAFLVGGLGGLAGHALATRLIHSKGGYEDHEERLALIESVVRSVQRAQKADRMRQLRAAAPADRDLLAEADAGSQPAAPLSPADAKKALRARVFGRRLQ